MFGFQILLFFGPAVPAAAWGPGLVGLFPVLEGCRYVLEQRQGAPVSSFARSTGCLVMGSGELCVLCAWIRALKNHPQIIAISSSPCGKARSEPEKPLLLAVMIHKTEIST